MACSISLFGLLTGAGINTTGNWTAQTTINNLDWGIGSDENTPPGSFSTGSFSVGNSIGSGAYLFIDPSNVTAGAYDFQYTVGTGSCADDATVTVTVQDGADAGTAVTGITWCNDDATAYDIFTTFLGGTPDTDGAWSGNGTANAGYSNNSTPSDPTDDTFQPSLAGVTSGSTTFTFVYTVDKGGSADCSDNCVDTTTISVTVAAAGNAGGNGAVTVCNNL